MWDGVGQEIGGFRMEGKSFWMDEERDGGLGRTRLEIRLG